MTIGKKLYAGFGLILAILFVLFIVNIFAGWKQSSASKDSSSALEALRTVESVRNQIIYLQKDHSSWLSKSSVVLDQSNEDVRKFQDETTKSANRASTVSFWVTVGGTFLALLAGGIIAFLTAKSITEPLTHLITVAREIGDSGDLDQNIDIHRNDEIGALATTFNNMVAYLKEMASVSMAVAEGDLSVEVVPRSKRDTLGNAFMRMSHGLHEPVRTTRDSAGQVSAGSNQV